jgi:hypothetical protein
MGQVGDDRKRNLAMSEAGETDLRARIEQRAAELVLGLEGAACDGRGIVVAAGGARLFVNVYVLAHVVRRRLACSTPMEVWHYGESELSPRMRALLAELDVATVDAAPIAARCGATIRDGWQLKPFALLQSRFAETLLLDADQVPVVDPSVAFDWPQFRDAGAVFWPDVLDIRADSPIWAMLGLPGERRVSLESGQVLIDRRRHLRAAATVFALNETEPTYRYVYGDKDTFLLGWMLTDAPFVLAPHRPFVDERALTQRDFAGAPFLQHRTNCKWSYSGDQHTFKSEVHREACEAALEGLRAAWNGRICIAPPRSLKARAAERALIEGGRLRCEIADEQPFELELWSDGEIGAGRSVDRANWHIEDDPTHASDVALTFIGRDGEASCRVSPHPNGEWAGWRLRVPAVAVVLAPIRSPAAIAAAPPPGSRRGLVDDLLAAADLAEPAAADEAGLRAALILLSRVEPEVAARLRWIAGAAGTPPTLAARLSKLADEVEASRTVALDAVEPHADLFERYYVRVPDPLHDWQN